MEQQLEYMKCRAITLVDGIERVDITVYRLPSGFATDEAARLWCEEGEQWKYTKLGWKLVKLEIHPYTPRLVSPY